MTSWIGWGWVKWFPLASLLLFVFFVLFSSYFYYNPHISVNSINCCYQLGQGPIFFRIFMSSLFSVVSYSFTRSLKATNVARSVDALSLTSFLLIFTHPVILHFFLSAHNICHKNETNFLIQCSSDLLLLTC